MSTCETCQSRCELALRGDFLYTSDRKGRVVLPSSFRVALYSDELVLTRGYNNCARLYPIGTWLQLARDYTDEELAFFAPIPTFIQPHTGRITIPATYREWMELKLHDEVYVCGRGSYVELVKSSFVQAWLRSIGLKKDD
jgi:DNA-binding transcriptional regulator/RsmH inhibitor MraZ